MEDIKYLIKKKKLSRWTHCVHYTQQVKIIAIVKKNNEKNWSDVKTCL